jgi:hypothetical protein
MRLNLFINHFYKEILILILILMSNKFPISMSEWCSLFKTNDTRGNEDECCTAICCPVKLPLLLLILPCTFYNICMNKCVK